MINKELRHKIYYSVDNIPTHVGCLFCGTKVESTYGDTWPVICKQHSKTKEHENFKNSCC